VHRGVVGRWRDRVKLRPCKRRGSRWRSPLW
jgi:hypothetical protein